MCIFPSAFIGVSWVPIGPSKNTSLLPSHHALWLVSKTTHIPLYTGNLLRQGNWQEDTVEIEFVLIKYGRLSASADNIRP